MLRQACVSTFKFAGLAFLGLNVRPKPAGPASTGGDLGTKIEEGVAAAAAAVTVPLVDPSAQPSPAPPVSSPSTSGGPDSSAGAETKPQADNPKPQMANPIGGGSANPKDGSTGQSVNPLAPTPPSAGGGTSGAAPTKPTRKATVAWGYPMFYKYTNHVVFYSADGSKNKDTNQATTNHVGCPSQGCIDKKEDGSMIQQPQGGTSNNNQPPVQPATVSQAAKSPTAASASGSDLVTIIEDLVADAYAGQLGGKIVEEVAVVATHVATDLGNKIVEGVTTVVASIAPLDDPESNPKPGPPMVANPIGGSANPEEGTASGRSVDPLAPPSSAGGSSGPASTSPTRNPLDPSDKYNHQAMFNIPDQSGAKATNQAGGPSQDAATPPAAGDKKDRPEGSIPSQDDGASNKPPQPATVVVSQADESQSAQQPHPDAIIRQYAREAWDISKIIILGYAAGFCMSF